MAAYFIPGSATEEEANTALTALNTECCFPIIGNVRGVPAPQNQQTLYWVDSPVQTLDGRWVIPAIPEERREALGLSAEKCAQCMAEYNVTVEDLGNEAFPQLEEVI